MPDISMCNGDSCPFKETCHRFTAPHSPLWQSFFITPPFKTTNGKIECKYYWDNKDYIYTRRNDNYTEDTSL